ncbi:hypothetical protein SEA_BARTIMEAUS_71 [Mycobacterium phage Bartimeaus]|uniref:Uncharacterized protein n=48 Tax=Backyardiganvirus TaxID=2946815 RepID=A0A1L5C1G5_9CAUD|nr:hypothetical protein SEA_IRACEMA64_71 [Mycobacterium phage Iracema64]ALF01128.1 hypothetical protein SEA_MAVERICK_70 [Mycobacterium phage Maverick]AOT25634.1 hypothetical protein SEA_COCOABERRY_71 [Mycobacterium phage Cocoaberry]APD17332.1 hypothetical protein PBI_ABDIEL_71 [Mycobacterium phage Abdiel]APD17501.1 hypothetical protein PBI_BRUISER_70 [Mycobacterium phage Bruiser]APD17587.1 hypothetical protein PBI_PALESTINO_70 [Mycobacterium phage Palestino]APD17677.1 hypothetical protein PBI
MPRLSLGVPRHHGAGSGDRGPRPRDHRPPSEGEGLTMYVEDMDLDEAIEWEAELSGSDDPQDIMDLEDVRARIEELEG